MAARLGHRSEVLPEAAWQRCYMHFLRNALYYVPRKVDDDSCASSAGKVVTAPLDPAVDMRVRHQETDVRKSRFTEAQIIGVLREQESRRDDGGGLSPARDQPADLLSVEGEVRRARGVGRAEAEERSRTRTGG